MSKPLTDFIDEWGFFVPMPEIVIERIASIGADAFVLFSYLRYRTHKERHVAWPAYPAIMRDTGMSRNRLASAIRSLESAKLLMRTKRFGASTVYRLTPPPDLAGIDSPETGLLDESKGAAVVPIQDSSRPETGRQSSDSETAVVHHSHATQDSSTQESLIRDPLNKDARPASPETEVPNHPDVLAQEAWLKAQGQLQVELSKATFDTWVRDVSFGAFKGDMFTLTVLNSYARDWLESRMVSTVRRILTGIVGRPVEARFVVGRVAEAEVAR